MDAACGTIELSFVPQPRRRRHLKNPAFHVLTGETTPIMSEIPTLADAILADVYAALAAGEDLRREKRGIGVRLRKLLTRTDPSTGPVHQARLTILKAIGRTEIGDQIRRGGGCHSGAEKAVSFSEDTDVDLLIDGLRQMADSGARAT